MYPTENPLHSGWVLTCARQHDHDRGHVRYLRGPTRFRPFVTRFLALPRNAEVSIETPRGPLGSDIRASVRLFGHELVPESGSYTAELLGHTAGLLDRLV